MMYYFPNFKVLLSRHEITSLKGIEKFKSLIKDGYGMKMTTSFGEFISNLVASEEENDIIFDRLMDKINFFCSFPSMNYDSKTYFDNKSFSYNSLGNLDVPDSTVSIPAYKFHTSRISSSGPGTIKFFHDDLGDVTASTISNAETIVSRLQSMQDQMTELLGVSLP